MTGRFGFVESRVPPLYINSSHVIAVNDWVWTTPVLLSVPRRKLLSSTPSSSRVAVMKGNTVVVCTLVLFVILLQGTYSSRLSCIGQTLHIARSIIRCGGSRFGRSQIRLHAYLACARKRSPAFICSDVALELSKDLAGNVISYK